MKYIICIVSILFIFSCDYKKRVVIRDTHEYSGKFVPSSIYTHHAKVTIKGDFSCEAEAYLSRRAIKYDINEPKILLGKVDTIIYDHDWYGDTMTIVLRSEDCELNKPVLKVHFYQFWW